MHRISFWFFQRGITPERETTRSNKKKRVSAIFPWGIHIWNFKWHARFIRYGIHVPNGRTHGRTPACTHNPKPICLVNFFEVGGLIKWCLSSYFSLPAKIIVIAHPIRNFRSNPSSNGAVRQHWKHWWCILNDNQVQTDTIKCSRIIWVFTLNFCVFSFFWGLSKCKLHWVACKVNEPRRGSYKLC